MLTQREKLHLSMICFMLLAGVAVVLAQGVRKPPKAIHAPAPDYPPSAVRDEVRGTVVVGLTVPIDGVPKDIRVVRGVRPDVDQTAVEAVRKWRFAPATEDSKPISVSVNVEVTFNITPRRQF
jgi:protein TonB